MTTEKIIQTIQQLLEQGETLVAATIVGHEGSTPRTSGSKMLVRKSGEIIGTIGGGAVEGQVIETALKMFTNGKARIEAFDLENDDVNSMDIICGGRLDVLIEPIDPNPLNLEIYRSAVSAFQASEKAYLVTNLRGSDDRGLDVSRALVQGGQVIAGALNDPPDRLESVLKQERNAKAPFLAALGEQNRFWAEPLIRQDVLYLFGAGHVSKETAAFAGRVGFHVIVLDDRPEFANQDRFPGPMEPRVIPEFENCFQGLRISPNDFLVILTRGHLSDKIVLSQALKTDAYYVGMIGSRRKRATIFKALLDEGTAQQDIDRVHSPIGLDIGAETPEEIAVSIVSELIQVRARKNTST